MTSELEQRDDISQTYGRRRHFTGALCWKRMEEPHEICDADPICYVYDQSVSRLPADALKSNKSLLFVEFPATRIVKIELVLLDTDVVFICSLSKLFM